MRGLPRDVRLVLAGTDPVGAGLLAIGVGGLNVEPDDQGFLDRGSFVHVARSEWCWRDVAERGAA